MFKRKYTDSELLDAVYSRDSKLIKYIMQLVWEQVSNIVLENSGTKEDAMQVMQDAFIAIYSKKEKPILVSKFSTYFIAICKNLWHFELRKRKVTPVYQMLSDEIPELESEIHEKELFEKRRRLYLKYFNKIQKVCQDVLRLVAIGFTNEHITTELAFSSVAYTKNRKSMCNKKLLEMIKADPEYKELKYGL
ncbi:sigma-70 family RNA polymerase sigma factor [Carboxylicivirga sediminis]|uniref:Sigma-70 family RNA polymerase sigma factor n=1 Tax=Carboxylicivirga sediminis TaxID=2006564 RepID=A0A941IYQ9_9BACT|nr:sigma-70 family RNA polymerase sigma factor [Carboxylicivirga sediminis]MBR8536759.1 sigma-70 family RNA polymerase sigma factor [Carboxylicivirga sediminis]